MKQRGFAPIIILIALVALGVAGYWIYKSNLRPESPPIAALVSPTPLTKDFPTSKPIPGWKTYSDNTLGFRIQYPADWTTEKVCRGGHAGDLGYVCFKSPDFEENPVPSTQQGLLVVVGTPGSSYFVASDNASTDFCKEDVMYKLKSCLPIEYNGIKMIKKVFSNFSFIDVAVLDQNSVIKYTIRLEYPYPAGYSGKTFDQFLSTFNFIK